jgi:uncharacterized phage-associated protein
MPYESKAIANYFLDCAGRSGKKLDPMQIQKLAYFAHGWHLAACNAALIDEMVEAWQYGPVIPSLYHEFKSFGKSPVTRKASKIELVGEGDDWDCKFVEPKLGEEDLDTRRFLGLIWNGYGQLTGIQLSNLTHELGSPWYVTWQEAKGRKNVDIPDELIRDYFTKMLDAAA